MKPQHGLFAAVVKCIPVPKNLLIDGLRVAAAEAVANIRKNGTCPDFVCGFDQDHDLVGLMLEDADGRGIFETMLFEYGFSVEFNEVDGNLEGKVRVWVRDDYEWTGTDKEAPVELW